MAEPKKYLAYTEHYKEECFTAWYSAGRPDGPSRISEVIPEDEHKRKPNRILLVKWRDELGWDSRADLLDAKAIAVVDDDLINARVLMLQEQAARGRELQTKGMAHIRDKKFDTSASAVQAVVHGAKIERTSRGLSERLTKLVDASDEELTEKVQKLLDRGSDSDEIIDVDEVDDA